MGVLDGREVLHVDKIDGLERVVVASRIGSRGPARTASFGKALLAASSDFAISLTGPSARFTLERVLGAGQDLSRSRASFQSGWAGSQKAARCVVSSGGRAPSDFMS